MASPSYAELLKDPRWQRKRLEVMERDGWKCTSCSDSTSTLNVHHLRYRYGADPWEYEIDLLTTLCESCHERATKSINRIKDALTKLTVDDLDRVRGYLDLLAVKRENGSAGPYSYGGYLQGLADGRRETVDELLAAMRADGMLYAFEHEIRGQKNGDQ